MSKIATPEELADLLGVPRETVKAPKLAPEQRPPFKPWSYDEIMSLPETEWLIGDNDRPVLLRGALWQTMGLLKSAKTFFSFESAFCISYGVKFHGMPVKQGRVAYVIAEGGIRNNFKRIRALFAKHEEAIRRQYGIAADVSFEDMVEQLTDLGQLVLIDSPVNLADPKALPLGVDALLDALHEAKGDDSPYAAVFLDTWARMLWAAGGHDSDPLTVGPSVQGCDRIRRTLNCTVVMIAHVGVSKGAQGRAKGLSDPAGAVDGATYCERTGEGAGAVYDFKAQFQRHTKDAHLFAATLAPIGDGPGRSAVLKSDSEGDFTVALAKDAKARALLAVLNRMEPGVSLTEWRGAAVAAGLFIGEAGEPFKGASLRKAFKREKDVLESKGAVSIDAGMVTPNGSAYDPAGPSAQEEFDVADADDDTDQDE